MPRKSPPLPDSSTFHPVPPPLPDSGTPDDWTSPDPDSFVPVPPPPEIPSPSPAPSSQPTSLPITNYKPSKHANFICPYCMREIFTGDLLYFCKKCKSYFSEKEVRENKEMRRIVQKQVYHCNENITSQLICPNCEKIASLQNPKVAIENIRRLQPGYFEIRNDFRVCMTGYSSSGKSQYITQLMDYIAKKDIPGIDSTSFLDNETQRNRNLIRQDLFKEFVATRPGYLEPLLFEIRQGRRSYFSVFYDIAGEDFQKNNETLATRCIWTSTNILLLVDPTTLPGVQGHERVKFLKEKAKASSGETKDPLDTYHNFVKENHYPKEKEFLDKVNLAIVFPKMDLFYGDDDFPSILINESVYLNKNGRYDVDEANAVSEAMKQWIKDKDGAIILNALKPYSNVRLFGISSGSEDPNKRNKTNRLLDPYLWLLSQNGILQ